MRLQPKDSVAPQCFPSGSLSAEMPSCASTVLRKLFVCSLPNGVDDAQLVQPTFFAIYSLTALVTGASFFGEFDEFTREWYVMLALGSALASYGVLHVFLQRPGPLVSHL